MQKHSLSSKINEKNIFILQIWSLFIIFHINDDTK